MQQWGFQLDKDLETKSAESYGVHWGLQTVTLMVQGVHFLPRSRMNSWPTLFFRVTSCFLFFLWCFDVLD